MQHTHVGLRNVRNVCQNRVFRVSEGWSWNFTDHGESGIFIIIRLKLSIYLLYDPPTIGFASRFAPKKILRPRDDVPRISLLYRTTTINTVVPTPSHVPGSSCRFPTGKDLSTSRDSSSLSFLTKTKASYLKSNNKTSK